MRNRQNEKSISQFMRSLRKLFTAHCSLLTAHCSLFIVLCSLFSCQTTPNALLNEGLFPFEEGASVYMFVDAKKARPFLEMFFPVEDKNVIRLLDLTETAAIAIYDNAHMYIRALGKYPSCRANFALSLNKDWKKFRSTVSKKTFWHSKNSQLSAVIQSKQILARTGGALGGAIDSIEGSNATDAAPPDPFGLFPITVPAGFNEFHLGSVFSCWFENASAIINGQIQKMNLPVEIPAEQLFIGIAMETTTESEQLYSIRLQIRVKTNAQARSLSAVIAIAGRFYSPGINTPEGVLGIIADALFSKSPVVQDNAINFSIDNVTLNDAALLFSEFIL
ncbi:MAG: hypothetical protein FWH41_02135 [Treponema sp.]|nr:hypothetical protein [Treponema sp.]